MKIHLIRSSDLDLDQFFSVYEMIRQYPGPAEYIVHEEPEEFPDEELSTEIWNEKRMRTKVMPEYCYNEIETHYQVEKISWTSIFSKCESARKKYKIPAAEPVVMLTEYANEFNWFSGADKSGKRNMFIQTGGWEQYGFPDFRYPVAYGLATIPLDLLLFDTFEEQVAYAHRDPKGCIYDLCLDKRQISLKLRTGDICPECRQLIIGRKIDSHYVDQAFSVFEGIRARIIFRLGINGESKASRLIIDRDKRLFILADYANQEIGLYPMEKAVYHFFLNHPDGIPFADMPRHYNELYDLYENYSISDKIATLKNRIVNICENKNDCLSQTITKIRQKIELAVPENMVSHYVIGGETGMKRKIKLDRSLVETRSWKDPKQT
jgi:hypothetical protein